MKRTRDTLTGGSKDVNPQTMIITVTQSGVDTATGQATSLPIPRLPIAKGRSLVIELLGVTFIDISTPTISPSNFKMPLLSTNPTTPTTISSAAGDPRAIAMWPRWIVFLAATAEVSYPLEMAKHFDLTDEAGHGILVATDQIYLYLLSVTTSQTNSVVARLEYRFKDVSLEEYIGIVQSQQ